MTACAETGYLSGDYARAVAGPDDAVLHLPRSGARVLRSRAPGTAADDLRACYPLLCCARWAGLASDLDEVPRVLSFVAVIDPLVEHDEAQLRRTFPDLLRPYKRHYVVDLRVDPGTRTSSHHRRNARRAARELDLCVVEASAVEADWVRLYAHLASRHAVSGPAAFDPASLKAQLHVPGSLVVQASKGGVVHAVSVWYQHDDVAYYHLGASDSDGYALRASFGMFELAFGALADRGVRLVDLGGVAGHEDSLDGLARFKAGWSTASRTALLGGRVLDEQAYRSLTSRGSQPWFPAYRAPVAP